MMLGTYRSNRLDRIQRQSVPIFYALSGMPIPTQQIEPMHYANAAYFDYPNQTRVERD